MNGDSPVYLILIKNIYLGTEHTMIAHYILPYLIQVEKWFLESFPGGLRSGYGTYLTTSLWMKYGDLTVPVPLTLGTVPYEIFDLRFFGSNCSFRSHDLPYYNANFFFFLQKSRYRYISFFSLLISFFFCNKTFPPFHSHGCCSPTQRKMSSHLTMLPSETKTKRCFPKGPVTQF